MQELYPLNPYRIFHRLIRHNVLIFPIEVDRDTFDKYINGIFTKTICEAKNKNQLIKAKTMAEEIGMVEGRDFFLIKDKCLTELTPEEIDENGIGAFEVGPGSLACWVEKI